MRNREQEVRGRRSEGQYRSNEKKECQERKMGVDRLIGR
jgi:hypothetical protein